MEDTRLAVLVTILMTKAKTTPTSYCFCRWAEVAARVVSAVWVALSVQTPSNKNFFVHVVVSHRLELGFMFRILMPQTEGLFRLTTTPINSYGSM